MLYYYFPKAMHSHLIRASVLMHLLPNGNTQRSSKSQRTLFAYFQQLEIIEKRNITSSH